MIALQQIWLEGSMPDWQWLSAAASNAMDGRHGWMLWPGVAGERPALSGHEVNNGVSPHEGCLFGHRRRSTSHGLRPLVVRDYFYRHAFYYCILHCFSLDFMTFFALSALSQLAFQHVWIGAASPFLKKSWNFLENWRQASKRGLLLETSPSACRELCGQSSSTIKSSGRRLETRFGDDILGILSLFEKGDLFFSKHSFSGCRIEKNDLHEKAHPMI